MDDKEGNALFSEQGADAAPGLPSLIGGKCECGHVFFPMQSYGCEKCGRYGSALKRVRLSGRGRLRALAQVYLHNRPWPKAPYTVGEIALEDGPVLRALLEPPVGGGFESGMEVKAIIMTEEREKGPRKAVRFALANSGGA